MKTQRIVLASAMQFLLCVSAAAHAASGTSNAVPPPTTAPAVHVEHATQATMLSSTRAGKRIVAVGDHGVILLSDDDGKTHRQARQVPMDVTLTSVSFADDQHGWAVGHWGVVLQTSDGGETWRVQRTDTHVDRPLFAVHFFDQSHGVAVGLWSLVLVTADGGANWQTVDLQPPEGGQRADLNLLGLFADNRGRVFAAAERGMVLRSDDRGMHWSYLNTGYKGSFWTGAAAPDGTLLVGGLRGSLYRSVDDGSSWQRIDTHSQSSVTALKVSGTHVIGVGLDGLILRSSDSGASVKDEVRADHLPLTSVVLGSTGQPVLYSKQGVVPPDTPALAK